MSKIVKKSIPPPDVEEGDILPAKVLDIKRETSKWKNDDGSPKEQLAFDCELKDGFKLKAWISYYEQPSEKSALGKLAILLEQVTSRQFDKISEVVDALKSFGQIFVRVKSFREYEDETYPNFAIVADKLPGFQRKISSKSEQAESNVDAEPLLGKFKDVISLGLPLNQNDWNNLSITDRMTLLSKEYVKENQGLYFFTEKAKLHTPTQGA